MVVTGKNLKLYYWDKSKKYVSGPCNLKEIESNKLGFNLLPGQTIYSLKYSGPAINMLLVFGVEIIEVSEEGVLFQNENKETFYPWEREFTNFRGETEKVHLIISPCEYLYEEPTDIEKLIIGDEDCWEGLWHRHGGWRKAKSIYEDNLKYFQLLGQQKLF